MKSPRPATAALAGAAQAHFHVDATRYGIAVPNDPALAPNTPLALHGGQAPQLPRLKPALPALQWRQREGCLR